MKKIAFTKKGFNDLKTELEQLHKQRPEAVNNLQTARNMGDLSENGAYRATKSKLMSIDRRIRFLKSVIDRAYVGESLDKNIVDIGCKVTVNDGKEERIFYIVGGYESDLFKGDISCYSPVGRALMRRSVGEMVAITTPTTKKYYKINQIEY
jgi:transcription elongation factor GreA